MRARIAKKIAGSRVLVPGTAIYDCVWNRLIRAGRRWWPPRVPNWVASWPAPHGYYGVSSTAPEDTDMVPSIITINIDTGRCSIFRPEFLPLGLWPEYELPWPVGADHAT